MRSDEGVDAFSGLLLGSEESWISSIFAVTHCSLLQLTVRNPSLDGLRGISSSIADWRMLGEPQGKKCLNPSVCQCFQQVNFTQSRFQASVLLDPVLVNPAIGMTSCPGLSSTYGFLGAQDFLQILGQS